VEAATYSVVETLRDGRRVDIRALRQDEVLATSVAITVLPPGREPFSTEGASLLSFERGLPVRSRAHADPLAPPTARPEITVPRHYLTGAAYRLLERASTPGTRDALASP
jgi:hypothetical protein